MDLIRWNTRGTPSRAQWAFLVLVSLLTLCAYGGQPSSLIQKPERDSIWNDIEWYGDIRLRYELDYDSVRSDGETARDDRNRFRTRLRLGLRYAPSDFLTFNLRLRHGDTNSQQSPHVTLWQDGGPEGDQSDVWIDRLNFQFRNEGLRVAIGREGLPLWKPHELYWDDDVFLDGGSIGYETKAGSTDIRLGAGCWALPDGSESHDLSGRSVLAAAQVKLTGNLWKRSRLTLADSLFFIEDDSFEVNVTNDDVNFAVNALDLQYTTAINDFPLMLGSTYLHNFNKGPADDVARGDTDGYIVYATLGSLAEKGQWLLGYYYADIEKYAVARYLAQDDWFRFGTATQTRSSDYRGHEFRVGYALSENSNIILRAYHVDTISTREDGNRVRLDLNYRF